MVSNSLPLDRDRYSLVVVATDLGNPAMTSTATVHVHRTNNTDPTIAVTPTHVPLYVGMSAGTPVHVYVHTTNANRVNITGELQWQHLKRVMN